MYWKTMNDYWRDTGIVAYHSHDIFLFILLIVAFTPSAAAADAMFRGDLQHTGVFNNSGIVSTNTELWQFKTQMAVDSSPAVENGVVYVGSVDDYLYAIDTVTGTEKWRFATGGDVESSPTVFNGVVYVGSLDNNLYAIDTVTGTEKWRFATDKAMSSSSAVENGVVYVGSWDHNLYAIDAVTGTEKWQFSTGGLVYSSPAVMNGIVYVGSLDNNLYAIDVVTGAEKWRFTTGSYVYSSPAIANEVIYIGSSDNNLYAINAMTGAEKWRFVTGNEVRSSPSVSNGVVYVGSQDKYLYAVGGVSSHPITTPKGVSTPKIQSTSPTISPTNSGDFNLTLSIIVILSVMFLVSGGFVIYRRVNKNFGNQLNDSTEIKGIALSQQENSLRASSKSQKNQDLIFISSKSEDFYYTQQVYIFLKDRNYNVFFSQQTLPDMGRSDYRKEIDSALDVSKHMIVVTSKKEYVLSSWVESEWGLFINEKRSGRKLGNIITMIIGTMRIDDLPSSLRYYEVIPFDPKNFEKILKYLK